ncbi:MAG: hypothetical protein ACUVX9_09655 [Anaerolineae bacterium]
MVMTDITGQLLTVPTLRVSVGEKLTLDAPLHESVGFTSECISSDPAVVAVEGSSARYRHPDRLRPGITGADEAIQTYSLRALRPGTALITLRRLFRGEMEEERVLRLVVG